MILLLVYVDIYSNVELVVPVWINRMGVVLIKLVQTMPMASETSLSTDP